MDVKNIFNELGQATMDIHAGIKVVKVAGDADISVFAAEIAPHTQLSPHFHKSGIENYHVLKGQGAMKVGGVKAQGVVWEQEFEVEEGDCFSIPEGKVHCIINRTDGPLLAVFTCPEAHLSTDRFFVE